jgi:hypothetical protein
MTEVTTTSEIESLLRQVVLSYQEAWNRHNQTHECEYHLTVTTHKVATPEGNKDVGYLRLDRFVRLKDNESEDAWSMLKVHEEMYAFKSIQEQANPAAPWREELYLKCLFRMASAGLEYAELINKTKRIKEGLDQVPKQESKLDLVVTDKMPTPLNEDEQGYKKWVKENSEFKK